MYPEGHDILHSLYLESMIWRSYPDLEVMPESAMLTKSRINCPYHALLGYKAGCVAGGNDFFKYALMFISLFYALLSPEAARKSGFTARDQYPVRSQRSGRTESVGPLPDQLPVSSIK